MQITSASLLEAIFTIKGNFAEACRSPRKVVSGVEVAPFQGNADAACCISADFEMGWGWRSLGPDGAQVMGDTERRQVPLLLKMFEEYSIPITWATIGHLFLESCASPNGGLPHPSMPRPLSDGTWSGDWYWPDPCSDVRAAPAWYGPDLIQQIIESEIPHEIGTHSFSHINFQGAYSRPEVVCRELESCIELMRPLHLQPRALVFPRNQAEYSYLPLLASAGVTVVRHRDARVCLSYPQRTESGVYKIYESMNLRSARHYDNVAKAKLYIEKAMERRAVYALWFHPSDPAAWFDPQLRTILEHVVDQRRRGRLWVTTMQALAAYCEASEQLRIRPERDGNSLTLQIDSSFDASRYGSSELTLLVPVPSKPTSGRVALGNGAMFPVSVPLASDGSSRVILSLPATAKAVTFTFGDPV